MEENVVVDAGQRSPAIDKPRSLAGFIQKNAKIFVSLLVIVLTAAVVFFAVSGITGMQNKKQIAELETLIERYDALISRTDLTGNESEIDALVSDLASFAARSRNYSNAKANSLIGFLQLSIGRWGAAEDAFVLAAKSGAKTHLRGVSLYNAAIAADEKGDPAKAIDYFTQSINAENAAYAAEAQFSIGRLNEKKGDVESARAAYRAVIENYTDDYFWTNLAHSRLLFLEGNG